MISNPIVAGGGKGKKDPELETSRSSLTFESSGYSQKQTFEVTRLGNGKIYVCVSNMYWAAFVEGTTVNVYSTATYYGSGGTVTVLLEESEEYAAAKAEVKLNWWGMA